MKKLLLALAIALLSQLAVTAQETVQYTKIINFEGADQSKLFDLCNEWIAINFKSANDVIQLADKENGTLICKGSFPYNFYNKAMYTCLAGNVTYTLKISVKENKIKVDFLDFTHFGYNSTCHLGVLTNALNYTEKGSSKKYQNDVWNDLKTVTAKYSEDFFSRIETEINKNLKSQNDW